MIGEKVLPSRVGIGSIPPKPVGILGKKKASTHHIIVEVIDKPKEKKLVPSCSSAFDRIGKAILRASLFNQLEGKMAMFNQQTWP